MEDVKLRVKVRMSDGTEVVLEQVHTWGADFAIKQVSAIVEQCVILWKAQHQ